MVCKRLTELVLGFPSILIHCLWYTSYPSQLDPRLQWTVSLLGWNRWQTQYCDRSLLSHSSLHHQSSLPRSSMSTQTQSAWNQPPFRHAPVLEHLIMGPSLSEKCNEWNYVQKVVVLNECLFVLMFNVPVNNLSFMSGRSHRFLGINLWGSNQGLRLVLYHYTT